MTQVSLLKDKMTESGMMLKAICEKSGISKQSLHNKMYGNSEFKASEIVALSKVLGLTAEERDEIFLQ